MKYFKFLMLFITMGMLQGCPKVDDDEILIGTINIFNNSEDIIYCGCPFVSENEIHSEDLDESLVREIKISPKSQRIYSYYENQFKGDYNKKIWILIYKQSTIDSHSWEEIQEQNLYDKRYSFTLDELNAMNWELVYNGN